MSRDAEKMMEAKRTNVCKDCGKPFPAKRSDTPRCPDCRVIARRADYTRYDQKAFASCKRCGAKIHRGSKKCRKCFELAPRGSTEDKFFRKVVKTDSCWIWVGAKAKSGHGHMRAIGENLAHRIAWVLFRGPIPTGMCVCHDCPGGDNPACVNPDHLFLGTHDDNLKDAAKKGMMASGNRHKSRTHPDSVARGEAHYSAKLTDDAVRQIRRRVSSGCLMRDVALHFGVTRSTVSMIVSRKRWAHVI